MFLKRINVVMTRKPPLHQGTEASNNKTTLRTEKETMRETNS